MKETGCCSIIKKMELFLTSLLGNISALLFFLIIIMVISLVILRYVFNSGIYGGNELMVFLFIYTTAVGAVVSVIRNDHIRISFFVDGLKQPLKKIAISYSFLMIAFINGVMVYYSIPWIRMVGCNESPALRIPHMLIQICIPVSCSLALLFAIYRAVMVFFRDEDNDGGSEQ